MSQRLPNPRLAKIHRNYTVEEVAALYGIHRNTVRAWIKSGLPTCDARRPVLILGAALSAFLIQKRAKNKRPCAPGEMYCMRCRVPQVPDLGIADYQQLTQGGGNLMGLCPSCGCMMNRRVSLEKLNTIRGSLDITLPNPLQHIDESIQPSVNSDLK